MFRVRPLGNQDAIIEDRSSWGRQGILRPYYTVLSVEGESDKGPNRGLLMSTYLLPKTACWVYYGRLRAVTWTENDEPKALLRGKKGTGVPHMRYVLTAEVRVIKRHRKITGVKRVER